MSWINDPEFAADRPFGPQTLPYGVIDGPEGRRTAVRVGQHAMPLAPLAGALGPRLARLVTADSLDPLLVAGHSIWHELRERLTAIVTARAAPVDAQLVPLAEANPVLPFTVADFVDFYSSRHHAENVGRLFRPNQEPLLSNWSHLPVGYHGRAGTVVISGTAIRRPCGQRKSPNESLPRFGPSLRLDIEAEVGFVCGGSVRARIPTEDFADHVFGIALVNDWSARDIQAWEYVPLGPFLGKSFATSIGAWITPLEAFTDARVNPPLPDHPLLPYLAETQPWGLDLRLEVCLNNTVISRPPFSAMSWSPAQQLAHLTVNGATARPGDLFASGTVSGAADSELGSILELTRNGQHPVQLTDGTTRNFLEDGDSVVITATAPGPGGSVVGLADVAGQIIAAEEFQ